MAASTNYLQDLIGLATAASNNRKAQIEADLKRAAGGTFTGSAATKDLKYNAPGEGQQKGLLDIGYERAGERLEGGLESRGLLRSGQAATSRQRQLSDYMQSVLDYYGKAAGQKAGEDTALAQTIADYEAKYGTKPQPAAPEEKPAATPGGPVATPSPSSVDKPAAARTPEESAAFAAFGQPENRQAATGRGPVQSTLPIITEPFVAAAYSALGAPQSAAAVRPAVPPKPATPPKPANPPKPATPPKPPAPAPVKRTTTTRMR